VRVVALDGFLLEPLVRDEPAFEATVLRPALSG